MIVNEQKPLELVNTCGALYSEEDVTAAILFMAEKIGKPVQRLKKVFMYGSYPGVAIHQYKIHLHRLLGMYWWFDTDLEFHNKYVHHLNHDKLDARSENLQLINVGEHQSHHNKGRIFTAEHRAKIGDANRTRWIKRFPKLYENGDLLK